MNAKEFISKIQRIQQPPEDILMSFDVTSLFTKVPVDKALQKLQRRLIAEDKDETLVDMARICIIRSTY